MSIKEAKRKANKSLFSREFKLENVINIFNKSKLPLGLYLKFLSWDHLVPCQTLFELGAARNEPYSAPILIGPSDFSRLCCLTQGQELDSLKTKINVTILAYRINHVAKMKNLIISTNSIKHFLKAAFI